jgi:hypothetical protein
MPPGRWILVEPILKVLRASERTVRKSVYCEKTIDLAPGSASRSQMIWRARVSILVPYEEGRSMDFIWLRDEVLISEYIFAGTKDDCPGVPPALVNVLL